MNPIFPHQLLMMQFSISFHPAWTNNLQMSYNRTDVTSVHTDSSKLRVTCVRHLLNLLVDPRLRCLGKPLPSKRFLGGFWDALDQALHFLERLKDHSCQGGLLSLYILCPNGYGPPCYLMSMSPWHKVVRSQQEGARREGDTRAARALYAQSCPALNCTPREQCCRRRHSCKPYCCVQRRHYTSF